jgi:outer membrane protein OmpA-like peptidoglycan-associated protein
MQNQGFIKLGMVALLSVTMVACQSTEEAATEAAPVANTATPSAANTGDGLTAEQRAARDRALAKTKFYFEFDKSDLSQEDRDALVFHVALRLVPIAALA